MRGEWRAIGIAALVSTACTELPTEAAPVGAVTLSSESVRLTLGDTGRLVATLTAPDGAPITGRPINWSVDAPHVVRVEADGVLVTAGTGSARVTAESGGKLATATVSVSARFLTVGGGLFHTCAVTARGLAACWGDNAWGKLGDGSLFSSDTPLLVRGALGLAFSLGGGHHSCATASGAIYCWGANFSGQIGVGDPSALPKPIATRMPLPGTPAAMAIGNRHTCALNHEGTVYCWGGGFFGQLGSTPSEFCSFSNEPCHRAPHPISAAGPFASVTTGIEHSCAIAFDGQAYCWGRNDNGQLGDGTQTSRGAPAPVAGGRSWRQLAAGNLHTCGLTTQGQAYCWGSNIFDHLGTGGTPLESFVPIAVAGGLTFRELTSGSNHTCGLVEDGTVYCWGLSIFGQGGAATRSLSVPTALPGRRFLTVEAGGFHTCGIGQDGLLYCWGLNEDGQLGSPGPSTAVPRVVVGQGT